MNMQLFLAVVTDYILFTGTGVRDVNSKSNLRIASAFKYFKRLKLLNGKHSTYKCFDNDNNKDLFAVPSTIVRI